MKHPIQKILVLLTVAGLLTIFNTDSQAADKKAAGTSKRTTTKSSVPAGMVPAAEALKRIKVHQDAITDRLTEMSLKYDRDVEKTLSDMFVRNKVHQSAMGYASSWAGNGVYLPWVNHVRAYYGSHLEALSASALPLQKGTSSYMKQSDLAYLDQGMADWKQKEKKISALMHDYVYHISKKAYYLGEALKYTGDNRYYSTKSPEFRKQYEPSVNAAKDMAEKAGEMELDSLKQLKEAGKWKVFSAITARDRVAVEEPQQACQEVKIFTRRDVPMPPELCISVE